MQIPQDHDPQSVVAAFFCPQAAAPNEAYLNGLYSFLSQDEYGKMLLERVIDLKAKEVWHIFAKDNDDVQSLTQGLEYIDMFHDWAVGGTARPLATARSGIVALPLLLVLQVGQYLRYLKANGIRHEDFIANIRPGGLQGYCGGLPSAMAIACASSEAEVVQHAGTAMRIMLGIGAYGEVADDTRGSGSTTLALRLKHEGQGEELTRRFPGTHVSAVTDPRSISIVGPAAKLHELFCYAREHERLQVQKMDIRGQVHNPDNSALAEQLCRLCMETPCLRLPDASQLQVQVRSNRSGQRLVEGSLTEELVRTILASRCEWWQLLNEVARDIKESVHGNAGAAPGLVYFGLTDCVATTPFVKLGLRPQKMAAHSLILRVERPPTRKFPGFPDDAIAVVGAACRLPGANNLEELWSLLASGTDCHRELPRDRFDLHGSFRAAQSGSFAKDRRFFGNFIDDVQRFDHAFFGVNPREAASMDPQQRILLEVAYEALEDAGYLKTHQREAGDRVGCFIGASLVEYLDNTNAHAPTAYTSTGTIRAFLCGRLSYYFGWSGPAEVIDTACSSSLVAINRACKAIQAGECAIALTGGVNLITGMNNYFDLSKAGFLSPTGQCKPFDISADGYCRSDGAGLVVLKKLKHAIANKDRILGVIPGITTNQGGLSASITVPQSTAQQALYRGVLRQAGIPPGSVTYVESHGTGTQAGDPLEMESIRSVFSRKGENDAASTDCTDRTLFVGSIKGNLGHCETAAGVAGLLKILAMIRHKKVPPQVNHSRLNPKIAPLEPDGLAISRSGPWDVPFRAALVNSYGAAGSNCALLCCEMPPGEHVLEEEPGRDQLHMALPLLVSGATEKTLIANARTLAAFLRHSDGGDLKLEDVAFTLQQKRPGLKYMASVEAADLKHAAMALESIAPSAVFQQPQKPPPVIFVFSGQSDTKIGLNRSFYDQVPSFRCYIEACNQELQDLGFSPIIPAIFEKQPLKDAYSLQCSMFALQYASAKCWIEAGLQPNAIIGHSLGELTALSVSGVLSLRDALKLVATRARLIDESWGVEKGAMLALGGCSMQNFNTMATLVQEMLGDNPVAKASPPLEIACYNGPESVVVVGTSAAIDASESLIRTEPSLQKIRARRLGTTHGFHSQLTEPLLETLLAVSQSLSWSEPDIPLEVCKLAQPGNLEEYSPSKHLREPVYFSHAIKRLEERFGPSVLWLEAGVDTAAVSLARGACAQPTKHMFLPIKTQGKSKPVNAVDDVLINLWKSGHLANVWSLIPVCKYGIRACKPVWLPPYQFERTLHWLPNIDRAAELQKLLEKAPSAMSEMAATLTVPQPEPPSRLIRSRSPSDNKSGVCEFVINTNSQRYAQIVGGHAVRSRSICPASMYIECVTMALQLLHEDTAGKGLNGAALGVENLAFDALTFSSPLGAKPRGEVNLRLEIAATQPSSWKFSILTLLPAEQSGSSKSSRQVLHAGGRVSLLGPGSNLESMQRLVTNAIEQLSLDEENVEKIKLTRTYSLFARVVDYAPLFRAIRTLEFRGQEGFATVRLPGGQPGREESTAWTLCDAVAIDAFVQVVGLIMNTSDSVTTDDVMVMVGLNHASISPKCQMDKVDSSWRVYARFGFDNVQQPIGDVFVCAAQGELVAILSGCRFSSLPISKLEKSLDHAMALTSHSQPVATQQQTQHFSTAVSDTASSATSTRAACVLTPTTSTGTASGPSTQLALDDKTRSDLRDLISECTGASRSDMTDDSSMADLGLDSLASVELVGELSSRFGINISSEDLIASSLNDLGNLYRLRSGSAAATPEDAVVSSSERTQSPSTVGEDAQSGIQKFIGVIVEVLGVDTKDIIPSVMMADLGLDSMSANDLKQELEDSFLVRLDEVRLDETVESLMERVGISTTSSRPNTMPRAQNIPPQTVVTGEYPTQAAKPTALQGNPFDSLKAADMHFDTSATSQGFSGHWAEIAPFEDQILVAYIVEAFASLGVSLEQAAPGEVLRQIPYQAPKYDKLVPRLWEILQKHCLASVDNETGMIRRGTAPVDKTTSSQLLAAFQAKFPSYEHESSLLGLTGPKLAQCLIGKLDSVSLMFGNPTSMKIMENFYGWSPMMSTLTEQLVIFLTTLLKKTHPTRPIRILEVGAGTGGTTKRVVAALEAMGVSAIYTFTDIAPSLVSKAKNTLKQYQWIEYASFNLEKEVPEAFRDRFDIVISTNCVHATTDRTVSCRRLRETLTLGGIIVLSEVTRVIDWYDICFGLLDGWWLAEGRSIYPIQPASHWMSVFERAGFASASFSSGPTPEATSQQLLVACNTRWDDVAPSLSDDNTGDKTINKNTNKPNETGDVTFRLETVVYKEVSDTRICADIFFPVQPPQEPMPIALMIHGGGHMTLSRRAVRPAQTRHLLANGILPVSIDYRLCPEVTLADGPMADVRDALRWARAALPELALQSGVPLDPSRVVAVGWSTGGQLAMSLAWTSVTAGLEPPAAVLSFYAPVDLESGELDLVRMQSLPSRKVPLERILASLPSQPITEYDNSSQGDTTGLGWVRPGDPRSELVLALFKEGIGLPLLLHGLPPRGSSAGEIAAWLSACPSPDRIAAVSPMARLRAGEYGCCPTYVIHGTADGVAPFAAAERFVDELKAKGIRSGLLRIQDGVHIHDTGLRPGMTEWEAHVAPGYRFLFTILREGAR